MTLSMGFGTASPACSLPPLLAVSAGRVLELGRI